MERWETVERFRERLKMVIANSGLSRSAFATKVGIDRSTLSQVLSDRNERLPRVDSLAAIASSCQVSVDWLIGLSETGGLSASVFSVERGARSPSDERLEVWRAEVVGYKIRYVPTTLPDLLRIDDVIEYEFRESPIATPAQRRTTTKQRLDYQRRPETDTEVCSPIATLEAFARGNGRWTGLSKTARRKQLKHMANLVEELYPTFRWFLFDGLLRYSVPLTIFGPKRAVIYAGQMFLVFNGADQVRMFTEHFDDLIRDAKVQPRDMATHLRDLVAFV